MKSLFTNDWLWHARHEYRIISDQQIVCPLYLRRTKEAPVMQKTILLFALLLAGVIGTPVIAQQPQKRPASKIYEFGKPTQDITPRYIKET